MRHAKMITKVIVVIIGVFSVTVVQAQPGPAPAGTVVAQYFPDTGGIIVSISGVNNWFVASESGGLTGADPQGLPNGGGLLSDDDRTIGETRLTLLPDFTDLDLGFVAAPSLPLGDLLLGWSTGVGTQLQNAPVFGNELVGQPGDFDGDLDVDGTDFLIWQRDLLDAPNLADWEGNFGTIPSTANLGAVPEPASVVLLAMAGLAALRRRRR